MKATHNETEMDEFHAVEFMRKVREKLSAEYQADRQKYLKRAREAMAAFKNRQLNAQH